MKEDSSGQICNTELPVVFNLHLPYLTNKNQPSMLQVACGHNVGINLLLGLPFLKAARAQINLHDQVVIFQFLKNLQLPLELRRCQLTAPADMTRSEAEKASVHCEKHVDVRREMKALDAWFYTQDTQACTTKKRPKSGHTVKLPPPPDSGVLPSVLRTSQYVPPPRPDAYQPPPFLLRSAASPGAMVNASVDVELGNVPALGQGDALVFGETETDSEQ